MWIFSMPSTHQRAGCQKATVRPGARIDPVGTRRRRVRRAPCWPFLLSEFFAPCLVWMRRCSKKLKHCWAVKDWTTEEQRQEIISCIFKKDEKLKWRARCVTEFETRITFLTDSHAWRRNTWASQMCVRAHVYTNLRALPLLRLRLEREAKLLLELT